MTKKTYEVVLKYTYKGTEGATLEGAAIDRVDASSVLAAFGTVVLTVKEKVKTDITLIEVHIEEK